MKPLDLLRQAQALGLRLEVERRLAVYGTACPPDFAALLAQNKSALIEWLDAPPCPGWQAVPPLNLPLDRSPPEPSPEQRACILDYLRSQVADHPGALAAWLEGRAAEYAGGPGREWGSACVAYAAARDAACWQLRRDEGAVCDLLAGFRQAEGI